MPTYKQTRDVLRDSLNDVEIDGPEWVKIKATIAALDDAEEAKNRADFISASRRLDDAAAKLRAIVAGLQPNAATALLGKVSGVLGEVNVLAQEVTALLSGEPATALPGMVQTNQTKFPTSNEPIVPPVRETARAQAGEVASRGAGVDKMIDDILRREGGFVNHPADRGGPTKFGVTARTLAAARGQDTVSISDVQSLSIGEARAIYTSRYFEGPKIDKLPPLVQPLVFDMSINHGPGTAIKLLQQVLSDAGEACSVDGGIGDETLTCAKSAVMALGNLLINRLVDKRVAFYKAIVADDASQSVFLNGWLNRANEFRV